MIEVPAYLAVGSLLGMKIYLNAGFLIVVITGMLMVFSLDLLSAGWNIITKTGEDPLNWFLNLYSQLVSGRMIRVWLLPGWIQAISHIHPQYYINEMARFTLGANAPISRIWPQLGPLLLLTGIVLVVGYRAFQFGFWKARDEGNPGARHVRLGQALLTGCWSRMGMGDSGTIGPSNARVRPTYSSIDLSNRVVLTAWYRLLRTIRDQRAKLESIRTAVVASHSMA